jgi:hypothetical protein
MGELKYFFSYSRKDTKFILKLAQELRDVGVNLWLDQLDILGGQHWDRAVEEALKTCHGMIVGLSPEAVASNNVMDEVSYALEEGRQVVPVLLRPCEMPFRLRRLQFIDFTADYDTGFSQLLRTLHIEQPYGAPVLEEPPGHFDRGVTESVGEKPAAVSERAPIRTEPAKPESQVIEGVEPPLTETPIMTKKKPRKAKTTHRIGAEPHTTATSQTSTPPPEPAVADKPASQVVAEPVEERPVKAPVSEGLPLKIDPAEPVSQAVPEKLSSQEVIETVIELQGKAQFWPERLKSALIGAAAGAIFGTVVFFFIIAISRHVWMGAKYPQVWALRLLAFCAIFTGIGWGIAGAISGMQRKVIAVTLAGMAVGFFVGWSVKGGPVTFYAPEKLMNGLILGTPIGAILGAVAGAMIKKLKGWT